MKTEASNEEGMKDPGKDALLMTPPPSVRPFHIFLLTGASRSDGAPHQQDPFPLGIFRPHDMQDPSSTFLAHPGGSSLSRVCSRDILIISLLEWLLST